MYKRQVDIGAGFEFDAVHLRILFVDPCLQTIVILDLTAPVIVCPPDATYECPGDTSIANNGRATATDACRLGDPEISSRDVVTDTCGATAVVVRTWIAVDSCGNVSSCDQTLTSVDTTAPVITCPDDVTVNCEGDRSSTSTGVATCLLYTSPSPRD